MKSTTQLATAIALLTGAADAFWRMDCHSRTGLGRIDPIVDPGDISSHSHAIHGGSNFGFNTTYDDLLASNCTSCLATQDKSAYWTPSMHFIYANGTTVVVPQVGGMLAYYLLYGENVTAFPANFRMLAGDTRLRNFTGPVPDTPTSSWTASDKTQFALGQKALGFNCMNYAKTPEASLYRHFLPDKEYIDENCANGIRAELFFPSCWNGKDLDSTNHRDHMAYPDLVRDGTCPEGFDTRLVSLFYETIWNTAAFKGVDGQFVFANGDPTGYGYHGDFMTGWEVDFLQQAVDTCTNPSGELTDCALFDLQTQAEGAQCTFETPSQLKDDDCAGPADGLCGNVPIQNGPGYASALNPGSSGSPTAGYTPPASSAISAVPTLSYKGPTTAVTDKFGGGISVAVANEGNNQPKKTSVSVSSTEVIALDANTPTSTSTPAPAAPATTQPPAQEPVEGSVIATSTYTSAGIVYEVAIEQVVQYVTVVAPEQKRHVHAHAHQMRHRRDREHGILGRHH